MTSEPEGIDREAQPLEFERIVSLSDGIFGFAMTLLVVSLVVPGGLPPGELAEAVASLFPSFLYLGIAFAVLGSAWYQHHRLFSYVQRANVRLIALNLALLATVVVVPFPHHVLSQYPLEPLAYALYAAALGAVLVMDSAMWVYASRAALFRTRLPAAALRAELIRGLVPISVFILSVPLAFVLVELTSLLWILLLPIDRFIVRLTGAGRMSQRSSSGGEPTDAAGAGVPAERACTEPPPRQSREAATAREDEDGERD